MGRNDREGRSVRGQKEVDAREAGRREAVHRVANRRPNVPLEVLEEWCLTTCPITFAADKEDSRGRGVLVRLMKALLALRVHRPRSLDAKARF